MKFYIIPGYGEVEKDYHWLISKAKKKYDVEFLNLQLKDNSLTELSKTTLKPNSIVFGFSTGALIAYKLKTPMRKGIYCSMSNILKGDTRGKLRHMNKLFGKKTTHDLKNTRYGKSKANEVIMFYGDKEMSKDMSKLGNIRVIKNTGHKFTKNYKEAVLKVI